MRLNIKLIEENESIKFTTEDAEQSMFIGFSESMQSSGTMNYNQLENKPTINSVVIQGALTAEDLGLGRVYYDTSEAWNAQPTLIAERSVIYIYSDAFWYDDGDGNEIPIASLKIGDGTSYLIDMPFASDTTSSMLILHIANHDVHVTKAEKEFWNNKVSAYINPMNNENLIFSKTHYEKDGVIIEG